jgi:hypothetical protein
MLPGIQNRSSLFLLRSVELLPLPISQDFPQPTHRSRTSKGTHSDIVDQDSDVVVRTAQYLSPHHSQNTLQSDMKRAFSLSCCIQRPSSGIRVVLIGLAFFRCGIRKRSLHRH